MYEIIKNLKMYFYWRRLCWKKCPVINYVIIIFLYHICQQLVLISLLK